MKKVFLFIAAAALTLAACQKQQYVIPVDDGEEEKTDPSGEEGYKETTFTVNITLKDGVNNTYDGVEGVMPGAQILEALDMTAAEFYAAMGSYSGSAYPEPQTSQENNTIMFGIAEENDTDNFKWIPSSANNFGHWFTKTGGLCAWGDDAYFFVESVCEWGLESPDAETLDAMWSFTVGAFPGRTAAGETYKGTHVFFYTDDDDVENYVYVVWNIKIEAAEEVKLNVVATQEVNFTSEFNDSFIHTDLVSEIDAAALQAAIGVSLEEADVYGINGDGTPGLAPGKNFWFTAEEGNLTGYGSGAGLCINDDAGTNSWAWCMYPDETLAGKTIKGAIAFVNPTTLNAYVVKVSVVLSTIDYLVINTLVSYEDGETEYTLTENNLAALAAALGVESVSAEEIGTTYPLKGINADGSVFDGAFTANNGYWYTLAGNVSNWGEIEAAGYVGAYLEYRGDYTFGCGLWEETGVTSTVKIGIGDAILTFNLEVDEAKSFDTEEAGVLAKSTSQAVSAGYGGGVLEITEAEVAALIEGTPDDWYVLDTEGNMNYTANGGFWYNANGEVCAYDDGAFYIEPGEAFPSMNTGIHPGNVTAAATFTGSFRIANPESGKHVTVNATITVTE